MVQKHNGINIIWRCHTLYMLQSFGLVGMPERPQHILCTHPRTVTTAKLVEEIKRCSSRWLKTLSPYYINFAWQGGYAIFSVSASKVNSVDKYIMNQNEHHKKKSFEEEYIEFLNAYNIKYDKDYVLKD